MGAGEKKVLISNLGKGCTEKVGVERIIGGAFRIFLIKCLRDERYKVAKQMVYLLFWNLY